MDDPVQSHVIEELVAEARRRQHDLESIDEQVKGTMEPDEHLDYLYRCLKALPQVGDVLAFSLLAKTGDVGRFGSPDAFASHWGITPTEHSSGKTQARGGMSKKGDDLIRSLLMEAPAGYLRPPTQIVAEDPLVPDRIRAEALAFKRRVYKRRDDLLERGLAPNKVKGALARELAKKAFCMLSLAERCWADRP